MNDKKNQSNIAIIGCGISGLACAILLADQGVSVTVYDKRDPLKVDANRGVSFNYTINGRGRHILKCLGVLDIVLSSSQILKQRIIHDGKKEKKYNYGHKSDHVLHAIPRTAMIDIIYQYAKTKPGIKFQFGASLTDLNVQADSCSLKFDSDEMSIDETQYDFVIGCDGVNSQVRNTISSLVNSKTLMEYFEWSYNEVNLTSEEVIRNNLDVSSLHVWPMRRDIIIVGIPNADNSTSCLYCAPASANRNIKDVSAAEKNKFIEHLKADVKSTLGDIESLSKINETTRLGRMISLQTDLWYYKNKMVLVGDAAHSIFPFYGQGMNAALQDSFSLVFHLEKHSNREEAFAAYQKERKIQTDILDRLSLAHFYFLRDKSHRALSMAKHIVDEFLCRIFHGKIWHHEYGMLAHSNEPFDKLQTIIKRQNFLRYIPPYLFLWVGAWVYYTAMDMLPKKL